MDELFFENSDKWREWLKENHDKSTGIWLVFLKQKEKSSIKYDEAVEEALCFGWIDSIIKKINNEKYVRKFSPRKDKSNWSLSNKNRIEKLIKNKRMTEIGMAKIEIAKKNGQWDKTDRPEIHESISKEFQEALEKNKKANETFNNLSSSYKKQFIIWINVAKQRDTKAKRIKESIELLEQGEKLGLK